MTTDTLGTVNQTHGHMTAGQQDLALTGGPLEVPMVHTTVSFLTCFRPHAIRQAEVLHRLMQVAAAKMLAGICLAHWVNLM